MCMYGVNTLSIHTPHVHSCISSTYIPSTCKKRPSGWYLHYIIRHTPNIATDNLYITCHVSIESSFNDMAYACSRSYNGHENENTDDLCQRVSHVIRNSPNLEWNLSHLEIAISIFSSVSDSDLHTILRFDILNGLWISIRYMCTRIWLHVFATHAWTGS